MAFCATTSTAQSGEPCQEDPSPFGNKIQLVLKTGLLDGRKEGLDETWADFKYCLLQHVCAARNTPDASSRPSSLLPKQDWWRLEIELKDMKDNIRYDQKLYERVDDKLSHLLSPKCNFADVFLNRCSESKIMLDVVSSNEDFATLDYKTSQTTNKGLVPASSIGMEAICFHMYEKKSMKATVPERCPQLQPPLDKTKTLSLSEDARLQFKRVKKGDRENQKKKGKSREKDCNQGNEKVDPKDGKSYVEIIWGKSNRSLGEYVSGFSKVERGGTIYYGIEEKGFTGYIPEGLPLESGVDKDIKEGICHKIRHEMLWIQRDPESKDGYEELKPDDIRCEGDPEPAQDQRQTKEDPMQSQYHFAVDFIRVQDPSSSQAKYVLEVRVAPFNGVVFYDPQGPEAYRMEKKEGKFEPVRVSKEEWLEKMRDYGWCSEHKCTKEKECKECLFAKERRKVQTSPVEQEGLAGKDA